MSVHSVDIEPVFTNFTYHLRRQIYAQFNSKLHVSIFSLSLICTKVAAVWSLSIFVVVELVGVPVVIIVWYVTIPFTNIIHFQITNITIRLAHSIRKQCELHL